jgi:hypothetical protein
MVTMSEKTKEDSKEDKPFVVKATKKEKVRPSPVVMLKPQKLYSFDQWATRRGVPTHHRGGMRAFVKQPDKQRTLEQWDECLKGY